MVGEVHRDTDQDKPEWESNFRAGPYPRTRGHYPRTSARSEGVRDEPFRDGLTSYGRSFDPPSDSVDLPAWTRPSARGSSVDPNAQGAYYTHGPGPMRGNRPAPQARASTQGTYYTEEPGPLGLGWVVRNRLDRLDRLDRRASQARAWLQAPLQQLSDAMRPNDKDRLETPETVRWKTAVAASPSERDRERERERERERSETPPGEGATGETSTGTQWTLGMGGWVLKPGVLQESTRSAVAAANSAEKSADLAVISQTLTAGQHTIYALHQRLLQYLT